ncbi:DNA repair protein RAD16, partial [Marasmius crinis-equi]
MMLQRLKSWLFWEQRRKWEKENAAGAGVGGKKASVSRSGSGSGGWSGGTNDVGNELSEALQKKDREKAQKQANRRRIRGGAPVGGSSRASTVPPEVAGPSSSDAAADFFAGEDMALIELNDEEMLLNLGVGAGDAGDITTLEFATEFDAHYGLIPPPQQVLIRAYSDDTDDR